jgi:outer membrane PBP1 activator LpoA protein
MLHRKQYRVAVRVTIMVLALTLTACGTQENTGSTESVKSTETVENTETVKGTETVESTETIENVEIIEAMVSESVAPQGTANVTPQMQPVEYTNLQQITLDPDWEYAQKPWRTQRP